MWVVTHCTDICRRQFYPRSGRPWDLQDYYGRTEDWFTWVIFEIYYVRGEATFHCFGDDIFVLLMNQDIRKNHANFLWKRYWGRVERSTYTFDEDTLTLLDYYLALYGYNAGCWILRCLEKRVQSRFSDGKQFWSFSPCICFAMAVIFIVEVSSMVPKIAIPHISVQRQCKQRFKQDVETTFLVKYTRRI